MFEINLVRKILKEYVDQGINQYIIYPFGINGVNVRNILKDCYGLKPCFIVDNEYCRYNPDIIDADALRDVYQERMYIILTVENKDVNSEILKEISEFIPKSNIINIYEVEFQNEKIKNEESKDIIYTGEGFRLQEFLPVTEMQKYYAAEGKIKVRITYSSTNFWNAINLLVQAFCEDPIFDVAIIIAAFPDREEERIERQLGGGKGYRYFLFDEYQMEGDKPDILILTNSFDKVIHQEKSSRKYARLIVALDMILFWGLNRTMEAFYEKLVKPFERHQPDFYLYDSLLYQELKDSQYFSEKIIEMGNPKFDGIYAMLQKKEYFGKWEKLRGKKSVLWATGHGIGVNSFDLYAKTIFEYAANHLGFGLIFRPHSAFIAEMLAYGYWSTNDLNRLKEYCDCTANVVYDDTETYDISMTVSDGILTDVFCGIACSALPMLKPICVAYRSKEIIPCHEELYENYYSAYDTKDIKMFFDMIRSGEDPMLRLREQASKKYIKSFDGKNSMRVKEFVKERYFELLKTQEET